MFHYITQQLAQNQIHPTVVDWVSRVIRNSGVQPSERTVKAADRFYKTLVANVLNKKVAVINFFAPDNLIAARTPLQQLTSGNDPWSNNGFVDSDITIQGLKGAANKFLNPNVIPISVMSSIAGGITIYISSGFTGAANVEAGCSDQAGRNTRLYAHYSDRLTHYYAFQDSSDASPQFPNGHNLYSGYMSANRIGNGTNCNMVYIANSSIGHRLLQSGSVGGGIVPSIRPITVMATNEAGTVQQHSRKILSFWSLTSGLTQTESNNLYNAVQQLRIDLGGGYV